jgi:hypothetical protein
MMTPFHWEEWGRGDELIKKLSAGRKNGRNGCKKVARRAADIAEDVALQWQ